MTQQYPNLQEVEFALQNLSRHDQELDLHERLILRNFRDMAINEQKDILADALERAQTYNTVTIAVGYTTFFASWAFFQEEYQNMFYDMSLLLMLFSVLTFVLWNVYSSFILGNDLFRKMSVIGSNINNHVDLYNALVAFDKDQIERATRRKWSWYVGLCLSLGPGVTAALIYFAVVGVGIIDQIHADFIR